jgi:type I restriction enzyme S subunit
VSELPHGWMTTTLGEILSLNYGKSLPDRVRSGTDYPVYGSNGVVGHHNTTLTSGETIIIGRKGSAGAIHHSAVPCFPIDTTYYIDAFYGMPGRYWYRFLSSLDLAGLNRSTAIPGLNREDAYKVKIPLPPLSEQKRIADKLEAILGRVEACRAHFARVPDLLKRYRQSILAAATSGRLTEDWRAAQLGKSSAKPQIASTGLKLADSPFERLPSSWAIYHAKDIVESGSEIVYGIVQPGAKLSDGVPYVRGMDIEDGRILVDQLLETSPEIAERYAKSSLKGGDVLLGIIRATKVARVPNELEGANITQGTARFRPSRHITSEYLAIVLESPAVQQWLHDHYRGIDMPGLNLRDVRLTPIPLPRLSEQEEIVQRAYRLLSAADRIKKRFQAADALVNRLSPSILAKTFRGELVPQDPADEPASALLERIRAERTTNSDKPRLKQLRAAPKMKKLTTEALKQTIQELPRKEFDFDELSRAINADYDQLSGMLISLLDEQPPILKQEFDKRTKKMRFACIAK